MLFLKYYEHEILQCSLLIAKVFCKDTLLIMQIRIH